MRTTSDNYIAKWKTKPKQQQKNVFCAISSPDHDLPGRRSTVAAAAVAAAQFFCTFSFRFGFGFRQRNLLFHLVCCARETLISFFLFSVRCAHNVRLVWHEKWRMEFTKQKNLEPTRVNGKNKSRNSHDNQMFCISFLCVCFFVCSSLFLRLQTFRCQPIWKIKSCLFCVCVRNFIDLVWYRVLTVQAAHIFPQTQKLATNKCAPAWLHARQPIDWRQWQRRINK